MIESDSTESEKVDTEHCCANCLARLGPSPSTEVQKPTAVSQKKSPETLIKINSANKTPDRPEKPFTEHNSKDQIKEIIYPPENVCCPENNDKENAHKWTINCKDGKICPTISFLVNRKKLEQIAKLSIQSSLNQKLTEILCPEIPLKESNSESRLESDGNEDKTKLEKWKYNCQKEKFCPTFYSMLHKNESEKVIKQDSEASFKKDIRPTETRPLHVTQKRNSNDTRSKNESDLHGYKQNISTKSLKGNRKSDAIAGSQKSVHLSEHISTFGSKNHGIGSYKDPQNPSVEIKATDLSQKPSQHLETVSSHSESEDENELEKFKRNCQDGVYGLQSLVDKCEKDPNSILSTFKVSLGKDRKLPNGFTITIDEPEQLFVLQKSHGTQMGAPKYHLLMVDVSTTINKMDFIQKESKAKIRQHDSVHTNGDEVVEEVVKDKAFQTYAAPNFTPKESEETFPQPVEEVPPQPEPQLFPRRSRLSHESEESETQKPIYPPREKKASILFKENLPPDMDEEERKRQNARRPSGVSWRALNTPSDSDSTASLEQVVKDATAKAETFRQNLDAKRQHSLLDIVKRKSTIDKKIEDPKLPPPPPPKRKKFFNFKCLEKKKQPPESEKEEVHSDSEEESIEDAQEKKPHSSSLYLDNYRRRNTSFIENPVFEKKKELNQFLNNI